MLWTIIMEFRTSRIISQGAVPIPTRKLICTMSELSESARSRVKKISLMVACNYVLSSVEISNEKNCCNFSTRQIQHTYVTREINQVFMRRDSIFTRLATVN